MRNSTPAQPVRIEPGQKQERPLAEKEAHPYLVRLAAGDYLHVVAEQRGVDLALRLTAPGGALIAEVDRCKGIRGVERVSEVATEAGDYRIDVVGNERTPRGVYEIRIDERHAATEADRSRVAGERFFLQGEKLRRGNKKEEAIKKYEQALALWQQAGDLERQASVLGAIGRMKDLLDQTEEAVKLYGQAADLFRRVGDPTGQAQALNQYGRLLFRLGRFEEARPLLEEAIRLYFYAGNDPEPEMGRGKLAETRDNFAEALPTTEPIGDRTQIAQVLDDLGEVDLTEEQLTEARMQNEKALALFRDLGDRRNQAITLSFLGLLLLKTGDWEGAQAHLSEALALFLTLGDTQKGAMVVLQMGRVALAQGDARRGLDLGKVALASFERLGDFRGLFKAHYVIAQALLKLDDPDQAFHEIEVSLDLKFFYLTIIGHD